MTEGMMKVGMADLKVTRHPGVLTTLGLGSCVGVSLYDPKTKNIGMLHIMLPSSDIVKNITVRAKFADTGIVDLISEMEKIGSNRRDLIAKLAGGAQMFANINSNDFMRVGARNAEAARKLLAEIGIPIHADDTGGHYGRTIELYSEDGRVMVKTIGYGVQFI